MTLQANSAPETSLSQALSILLYDAQQSLKENPRRAGRCIDLAVDLLSEAWLKSQGDTAHAQGGLSAWRIARVRQTIEENIDHPLSSTELAAAAGLSPSRFARAFKVSLGVSPHQYLMRARIDKAKALMLTTMDALSDIAIACGMSDQSHFSRLFLRFEGETPTAWRRRHAAI